MSRRFFGRDIFHLLIPVISLLALGLRANVSPAADVSWAPVGPGGGGAFKDSIVVDPSDANFAMVGTDTAGPVVTANGGTSWTMPMEGLVGRLPGQIHYTYKLAMDPVATSTVYFASMGLYKTANFGGLWVQRAEAGTSTKRLRWILRIRTSSLSARPITGRESPPRSRAARTSG